MAGTPSTTSRSRTAAALPPAGGPDIDAGPAPRLDPVGAVAAVLIVTSVLWRLSVTGRGYLTADDFAIIAQADEYGLGGLFTLYNNHFMPAGRFVTYVVERFTGGYEYLPYAALMALGQLAVSVAFYRVLRLVLPAGWALLLPLSLFLFNPMTLEISAWWAVGVNMLPLQLAMLVALAAHIRYMRTGNSRHLVTIAAALLVGLLFFEKAVFIAPLLFLVSLFLYAPGGPVRALVTTIKQWWRVWALLTALCLLFLGAYLATATGSSMRVPRSAAEVGDFLHQFYGSSLASGLVGGPWSWLDAKDGPAVAAPSEQAQWLTWAVIAVVVAVTVWLRRSVAARAWALMVVFAALAAALIAATRLGSEMSGVAGLVPRYLGDVLLLAALCVGVAVCGLRPLDDDPEPAAAAAVTAASLPAPVRRHPQQFVVAFAVALALLIANSVWSSRDWASDWASKAARDYITTTRAELAKAEPGTVFMDQPVPDLVMSAVIHPWNMQSKFFGPEDNGPSFVTEAAKLSVIDDSGRVRPAWVKGVKAKPGPLPGCGYQVTGGRKVTIPLDGELVDYWHTVRIGYLSDRDTKAYLKVGHREAMAFDVHRGLNAMFLLRMVDGDEVQLSVEDPKASFCTDEIEIGDLVPQPVG